MFKKKNKPTHPLDNLKWNKFKKFPATNEKLLIRTECPELGNVTVVVGSADEDGDLYLPREDEYREIDFKNDRWVYLNKEV